MNVIKYILNYYYIYYSDIFNLYPLLYSVSLLLIFQTTQVSPFKPFVACLKDQVSNMLTTAFDRIQIFLKPSNDESTRLFREYFTREFQSTYQQLTFYNWKNAITKLEGNKTQMVDSQEK